MITIEQSGLSLSTVESGKMIYKIALHTMKPSSFGKLRDKDFTLAHI